MFNKILIANRGEIACRIIHTARKFGIRCVAIYSEADRHAVHVKLADEAYCVGKATAQESYLRDDVIINTALKTGCEAIHPGYGFLSENAEFAEQCDKSGICFIGPPIDAIRAMGSKSAAKKIMAEAKVPLLPGYHGEQQDDNFLLDAAESIGYPLLIKAVAGGGGKGMRIVSQKSEFLTHLLAARREAAASFKDDRVLLEKYLVHPRHVEIQIFADKYGNVVHLFERDCSLQRRHQKIIEEAPAPHFSDHLRNTMGKAAITAAHAINYVGAGTVEFLLDENQQFYFMEMNTRLQVEHPITEMITGQDLVAWQLRIACGEKLAFRQTDLKIHGHAFEARIYAEDPAHHYSPSTGVLHYLKMPEQNQHVRIDTGIQIGSEITPYYDAMLAKLIVWDQDREQALKRLQIALANYQIVGVTTNLDLLTQIAHHPAFADGDVETGFIDKHKLLAISSPPIINEFFVLAALAVLKQQKIMSKKLSAKNTHLGSPWLLSDSWRMNFTGQQLIVLQTGDQKEILRVEKPSQNYVITINEKTFTVNPQWLSETTLFAEINQQKIFADIYMKDEHIHLLVAGNRLHFLHLSENFDLSFNETENKSCLTSPMPGKVVALLAEIGKPVAQGDALAVIEAMKMEHTIYAPAQGIVNEWYCKVGDMVDEGFMLLDFTGNEAT